MKNPGALAGASGAEKPSHATAEGLSTVQNIRAKRQHHETANGYGGIVARLCDDCRVVVCKDHIQGILQSRVAQRAGWAQWKAVGCFITRDAPIRVSRTMCARLEPGTPTIPAALPDRLGGVA